ncbi:hypothetical protein Hamer_G007031 [Homarus americanus]|uniref:Uncharacterized protein n=1 Tax=Homarus americanus TaxID=6706 RepID=A0A8J5N4D3_HOMAM|nr:hypothetical protein Hamer_G007031 [Homarus americanus]
MHENESSSSSEGDDKDHDVEDELFQALYETPPGMKKTVTFSSVSWERNRRKKIRQEHLPQQGHEGVVHQIQHPHPL